jgi:TonB family protein
MGLTAAPWQSAWRAVVTITLACAAVATAAQSSQPPAAPPGPLERAAVPITPENPIPRRLVSRLPLYPDTAGASQRTGTVTLRITIDQTGRVAEWRQPFVPDRSSWPQVVSGKPMLVMGAPLDAPFVKTAMDAVSQWRYDSPAQAPISLHVKFGYASGKVELLWHDARPPDPAPLTTPAGGVAGAVPGGVPGGVPGRVAVAPLTAPPPPASSGPVRVGGNISPPVRIKNVPPVYPDEARAAKVQGTVILETTIDQKGLVTNARVLRSVPLLDQAALDAVRQWEFMPTLLNGQPVAIIMTVTVNFTLQ